MALSGWCSTHGRPQCDRCRVADCEHACHAANQAQNKADVLGATADLRDNRDAPAGCVNTAARADHLPFANNERG